MARRYKTTVALVASALLASSCNRPPPPTSDKEVMPAPQAANAPCRQDPDEQHQLENAADRWVKEQGTSFFSKAEALQELCAFEHFEFLDGKAVRPGSVIKDGDARWDVKICSFETKRYGWVRIRATPAAAKSRPDPEALRVPHDTIDRCLDPHDVYSLEQTGASGDEKRMEPGSEPWRGIVLWRQLAPTAPEKDDRQGAPPYRTPDND